MEDNSINRPFKPGSKIAESLYRDVEAHSEEQMVVKSYKESAGNGTSDFTPLDVENLHSHLVETREQLDIARAELQRLGGQAETIPEIHPVIHQTPDGALTYSDTQEFVPNGVMVRELGLEIANLPRESLEELKRLFQLNLHYLEQGKGLDIVGSSEVTDSIPKKILGRLFPLLYSSNIMIDEQKHVKYIDPAVFDKAHYQKVKSGGMVNRLLSQLGSNLTIGLIDIVTALKSEK